MDGAQFDRWTKRVAQRHTRRRLLHGLASSGTAVGLGLLGHHVAEAVICRQPGVLCAKDAQCCSGNCIQYHCACPADTTRCGGACCEADQVCAGGTCCTPRTVCPHDVCGPIDDGCGGTAECSCLPGQICLGTTCCTPATICAEGACGPVDDGCGGTLDCGSCDASQCLTCRDGTCGSTCTAGQICQDGTCICPDCTTTGCGVGCLCSTHGTEQCPHLCFSGSQLGFCTTSAECPAGSVCFLRSGCFQLCS